MKKITYITKIIAVLITAVFITGCSTSNTEYRTASDICIFRQRSDGIPIRTMLTSGITSSVCIDPLCMHDDKCPLYGISNISGDNVIVLGNHYCFISGDVICDENSGILSGEVKLCVYHMIDGTMRVLETYRDNVFLLYGYDKFLYYITALYSKSDLGERYDYVLYRADIKNGSIEEIPTDKIYSSAGNSMNTNDIPSIYTIDKDRIYWYAPGEDGYIYYTTNLAGKDRRELMVSNPRIMNGSYYDGWAYYTVNLGSGSIAECRTDLERQKFLNQQSLHRYHIETGKDEVLVENLGKYTVTEDGIFYTVCENAPAEIKFNGTAYYDIFGGKLYRMNHDGSNSALICTLNSINISVWSDLFIGYADRKLALSYMDVVQNDWFESGYEYNIAPEIIIVDITDGTWMISNEK